MCVCSGNWGTGGNGHRILRVLCSKLRLEGNFDFTALAKLTPGYVGADLSALTGAAGIIAVKRIFKQISEGTIVIPDDEDSIPVEPVEAEGGKGGETAMEVDSEPPSDPVLNTAATATSGEIAVVNKPPTSRPFSTLPLLSTTSPTASSIAHFLSLHPSPLTPLQLSPLHITSRDFHLALAQTQPSSLREGFTTVPLTSWSDIGALHSIRSELHMAVVQPIRRPEVFRRVGIERASGVLMWGPPGCGKTLLAKAVAGESGANFISVKGPEVLNKVRFLLP